PDGPAGADRMNCRVVGYAGGNGPTGTGSEEYRGGCAARSPEISPPSAPGQGNTPACSDAVAVGSAVPERVLAPAEGAVVLGLIDAQRRERSGVDIIKHGERAALVRQRRGSIRAQRSGCGQRNLVGAVVRVLGQRDRRRT